MFTLKRRDFLIGTGTIAVAQLLAGCTAKEAGLRVQLLQGSIPSQVVNDFRSTLARSREVLIFKTAAQLNDLFNLLETWEQKGKVEGNKSNSPPINGNPFKLPPGRTNSESQVQTDLVTIGNYWLTEAIEKKLIQPLLVEKLSGWQNLPLSCQKLVKRNQQGELDETGQVWGAPYRWGCTLIAYRRDKFKNLGWTPKDWSDLWREELRDRISLLDHPREAIGLVLKKLGHSYNTRDLNKVSNLKSELQALQQQVKFYDSKNYLEPLVLEDTWLAVGWSSDLLPLRTRIPEIEVVVPRSGTSLWADLWVKPASNQDSGAVESKQSLVQQWINFCWQPQPAIKISLLTNAASPIISRINSTGLPKDIRNNPVLFPDSSVMDKSEFIMPLPKQVEQQYESLWKEIRLVRR